MIKRLSLILSLIMAVISCGKQAAEFDYLYENLPFEMAKVTRPDIPDTEIILTDFGAVGDGVTLNTEAFASAIAALEEAGGGHLIVPEGIWLTGPIELKSHMDLHVTPNAIIVFDPNLDLYPVIHTIFEGLDTKRCESPIHAEGQHDISITGGGIIDGNGDYWRMVRRDKLTDAQWANHLATRGGIVSPDGSTWFPDEGFIFGQSLSDMNVPRIADDDPRWAEIKSFLRPVMISFRNCQNILLEDCTFQNSPCWNIHPLLCKNVIVNEITVRNPWYSQNGDGIDIDSCEDVIIVNSSFDVGDDAICVKSGKDEDGRRRARPCKNLIVDNCTVYHGHGGFTVGSEMSGGVENIKVSNCRFLGTDVGLRFKSKRGRGGVVKNIYIDKVFMKDIVGEALLFDLYYMGSAPAGGPPPVPVDETTPSFRDIYITDTYCSGAAKAMFFNGLPEMPLTNINITGGTYTAQKGIELSCSENVTLSNVQVTAAQGEPVVLAPSVSNVTIE